VDDARFELSQGQDKFLLMEEAEGLQHLIEQPLGFCIAQAAAQGQPLVEGGMAIDLGRDEEGLGALDRGDRL
jgi:hypothetical protein